MRHRVLAVNRRGGERQNILQVGSTMLLSSELYQPLDSAMARFVAPYLEIRETTLPLWKGGERVAEYRADHKLRRLVAA